MAKSETYGPLVLLQPLHEREFLFADLGDGERRDFRRAGFDKMGVVFFAVRDFRVFSCFDPHEVFFRGFVALGLQPRCGGGFELEQGHFFLGGDAPDGVRVGAVRGDKFAGRVEFSAVRAVVVLTRRRK